MADETKTPEPEVKERYTIWLPDNHPGSRRVVFGSKVMDLDKPADSEDFANHPENNHHEIMATKSEINDLRDSYGFAARKMPKKAAAAAEAKEATAVIEPPTTTAKAGNKK
jgi:hypothetical protein